MTVTSDSPPGGSASDTAPASRTSPASNAHESNREEPTEANDDLNSGGDQDQVHVSETRVFGYRRQRFEARKVRRLIRHIDPWSVLKLSLLLALCMWLVAMVASVIIWSVASNTGAIDSLEKFINDNLQLEDFKLTGTVLFRQFGLISLLGALGFTAAAVVMSLVFNLISDIIGGVWVSVIEEETARPITEPRSPGA